MAHVDRGDQVPDVRRVEGAAEDAQALASPEAPRPRPAWTRATPPSPGDVRPASPGAGRGSSDRSSGRAASAACSARGDGPKARSRAPAARHHRVQQRAAAGDVLVVEATTSWSASRQTCLRPGWVTLPAASFILGPGGVLHQLVDGAERGASALVPSWVPTPKASIGAPGQQGGTWCSSRSPGRQDLHVRQAGPVEDERTSIDRAAEVARVEADAGDGDTLARQLARHSAARRAPRRCRRCR